MLHKEENYAFRHRMLQIHKPHLLDPSARPHENECILSQGVSICIPQNAGTVLLTAAKDFADYLFTSMDLSCTLQYGAANGRNNFVELLLAEDADVDLGDYSGYRGYRIVIENGISVYGNDERGIAQALYYLEFLMTYRKAPFFKRQTLNRKPRFSPMMVHSGYGLDEYPNEHLSAIAHEGRDAILVFTKAANISAIGFMDFNTLIFRAARYGLDVYAYSYIPSKFHPEDDRAAEYYESTYGQLFKTCPGLKGVVLVGESICFPSKDPRAAKADMDNGIPSVKPSSFYYPCIDYVQLVSTIRDACRKYRQDADIVFWTYNFGWQPAQDKMRLLNALPEDITIQTNFDKSLRYPYNGITQATADYTLADVGGYECCMGEEAVAKSRGLRLYAQVNTAGMTWDMGVIPYEPFPYQWMKRYKKILEARDECGLCGLMESHHYGIYPSFISTLSNLCLTKSDLSMEENLIMVLSAYFGAENLEKTDAALKLWSEAITYYSPTGEDQYGAFRVGPSYPFCLGRSIQIPSASHAMFGNSICVPHYCTEFYGRASLISRRIWKEIEFLKIMKNLLERGLELLETIDQKNENLQYLINMGHFMVHYVQTGLHAKQWHTLICRFNTEQDTDVLDHLLQEMESLLTAERANALQAIPYVEFDSRLGWEPSMEYMCDRSHLEWKVREIDYVLQYELVNYRKSLAFDQQSLSKNTE